MRALLFTVGALLVATLVRAEPVALLEGKLKFDTTDMFVAEKKQATTTRQSIGDYQGRDSDAWGTVSRGTHGLKPDGLGKYMDRKVAEYTKGLSWLPRLDWLKKEIVTINGRPWADICFIAPRQEAKDARDGLMYTRIFATSFDGQLLEIMFTSNTDPEPATKDKIDKVIESVQLVD